MRNEGAFHFAGPTRERESMNRQTCLGEELVFITLCKRKCTFFATEVLDCDFLVAAFLRQNRSRVALAQAPAVR